MSDAVVSIVLTTYNGEEYLSRQLDSIIEQTHCNLQIIICDDASRDQTRQLIEHYAAQDGRIVPVYQATNIGLHANLEKGLQLAKGDYIAISDQDDIWRKDKIEKLLRCIQGHAGAFSDSELIDAHDSPLGKTILQAIHAVDIERALLPLNLVRQNVVSGHSLLFRRSLLAHTLPFLPDLIFDHHLAIIASMRGGLFYYPEPLVQHRIHGNNHTNSALVDGSSGSSGRPSCHPLGNADNPDQGQDPGILWTNRALRRRLRHDFLHQNLMLLLSTADEVKGDNSEVLRDLRRVADAMKRNRHRYFDVRVYLALHDFDKKYNFFGFKKRIKLCKGAIWYRSAEIFGMR